MVTLRRLLAAIACIGVVLTTAGTASAASWAQFGAGAAHTGFNALETTISADNVAGLAESCAGAVNTNTSASPAVVGRRVFVATWDGVAALDAATCATVWTARLGAVQLTSPAVADGLVHVASMDSSDGRLFALDAAAGAVRWTALAPGGVLGDPSLAGGRLAVGDGWGAIHVFDAATGAPLWTRASSAAIGGSATTAISGGVLYASTSATVKAFRASSGAQLWTRALRGSGRAPVVAEGRVYVSSAGAIHALDAATGAPLWQAAVDGEALRPLAVANGRVHSAVTHRAYAFDAATGQVVWSTVLPGASTMLGGTMVGPSIANGLVYLPASFDPVLNVLDASTGALRFTGPLRGQMWHPVAVVNGAAYASVAWASSGLVRLAVR